MGYVLSLLFYNYTNITNKKTSKFPFALIYIVIILAFLFNLITILTGIYNLEMALVFFMLALLLFSFAILVFLIEIQLSSKALKTHLDDLENI